jgi:N-acetyl-D-muramate 6-phosphate phosphatase
VNSSLSRVLASKKHVLVDFDGPICSVFAGVPASVVAQGLRSDLVNRGGEIPAAYESETDPLALLRRISIEQPDLTVAADEALTRWEEKAVLSARPTVGGRELLEACIIFGRKVWLVSNNASSAISTYLAMHGLKGQVSGVFGRVVGDPSSMKPSPRLLIDAMSTAAAVPQDCIFIGDAVRDVQAGDAAGIDTIGYANKQGKKDALAAAGAVVVVESMISVANALAGE